MHLALITPPAVEPVTLSEAKNFLRVEHNDDDALIDSLIAAARQRAELIADSRQLITATWELWLEQFPESNGPIELPRPPLQSVTWLKYTDAAGNEQTLTEGTDYVVEAGRDPGRIWPMPGASWPATQEDIPAAVKVRFIAGYGDDGSAVPAGLRAGLLLWIAHHYDNRRDPRDDVADGIFRQYRWGMIEGQ